MPANSKRRIELLIVKQVLSLNLYNAAMFHGCEQDSEVCLIDTLLTVGFLLPWDCYLPRPSNPSSLKTLKFLSS